jgi:hypothetical protein
MTANARLVMSRGPQPGQTFVLDRDPTILGRAPTNEVTINDPQVSRQHARIVRDGALMVIEDMGSTNGTFVNGVRLTSRHALANGDVISLGDAVTLSYYGAGVATTEPLAGQSTIPTAPVRFEQLQPQPQPAPPPSYPTPPVPALAGLEPLDYGPPPLAEQLGLGEFGLAIEEPVEEPKRKTWLWIGCAGLVVLVVLGCIGVVVLDYLAVLPDFFYQPLFWFGLDKYFVQ